jgi:hypothetical protein
VTGTGGPLIVSHARTANQPAATNIANSGTAISAVLTSVPLILGD